MDALALDIDAVIGILGVKVDQGDVFERSGNPGQWQVNFRAVLRRMGEQDQDFAGHAIEPAAL
jgi:hypothetical protein